MRPDHFPAGNVRPDGGHQEVRVWDIVVRLFHWTVVTGCVLNLFILEDGKALHRYVGYTIAAALAIRIVWGFVGTRYARFSDFAPSPSRVIAYLKAFRQGREPRMLGHNPAAAVMMLTLMFLLAATCLTGWMQGLDAFWGDDWLEEVHAFFANSILVLALAHAAAALFESWRHRENLVWSMVTGRKRA